MDKNSKIDKSKTSNNIGNTDSIENFKGNENIKNRNFNLFYSENYTVILFIFIIQIIYDKNNNTNFFEKNKIKEDKNFDFLIYDYSNNIDGVKIKTGIRSNKEITECIFNFKINIDKKFNYNNETINLKENYFDKNKSKNKGKMNKKIPEINLIKNLCEIKNNNPENILKFNNFNLKKFYQKQTTKKENLIKINESSESESDSTKKITKNVNNQSFTSDFIDLMDKKEINLLKNSKNEDYSENIQEKQTKCNSTKKDNEVLSNVSENKNNLMLKNLTTNDTTSSISSKNSNTNSKENSFCFKYNTVKNLILYFFQEKDDADNIDNSIVLSEDEKEILKKKPCYNNIILRDLNDSDECNYNYDYKNFSCIKNEYQDILISSPLRVIMENFNNLKLTIGYNDNPKEKIFDEKQNLLIIKYDKCKTLNTQTKKLLKN